MFRDLSIQPVSLIPGIGTMMNGKGRCDNDIFSVIPQNIVVHLGRPGDDAQNINVSFPDYIKMLLQ